MKRKGFTLIELLAVIVILSVITLITVPMITSVIEESKKKALVSSVQGLIESANLYAIENEGVYEFLFDKEHQGSTQNGEGLDYKGKIEGKGKLYIDKEGNTSICISNDTYYVYKNYNSEIIIGERSTDNCNIEYDALTNKYVAFLESTGSESNVYSKDEVNNLVDSLDTKITNNTNEITNIKSNIEELQTNLNNYASQSELEKTNTNVENLSSLVNGNTNKILNLENNKITYSFNPNDVGQSTSCANSTAAWAKEYFSLMPSNSVRFVYNASGIEYTLLFSKKTDTIGRYYGVILRFGYNRAGIDILRVAGSSWYSNDWEAI